MTTRNLILVRHSQSRVIEGVPAANWELSPEGQRRCTRLAQQLEAYKPTAIITSHEQKARETGQLVGTRIDCPVFTNPLLHEHDRRGVPFLTQDAFLNNVRALFERPDELIFGQETGRESLARFSKGINEVIAHYPQGNIVVVTHGTVLTLFVASHSKEDPFHFWQQLGQPAYVVFDIPGYRLATTAFTV